MPAHPSRAGRVRPGGLDTAVMGACADRDDGGSVLRDAGEHVPPGAPAENHVHPAAGMETPPVTSNKYFPAFSLTASWSARSTASPAAAINAWL